jgi:hypothetical protein
MGRGTLRALAGASLLSSSLAAPPKGFPMNFSTRFTFSFTTVMLALAASACASSLPRAARNASGASCGGGIIATAPDAARFSGCSEVQGDLRISSAELDDLSVLAGLRGVSGTLEIAGNPRLDDLGGLERLERVGRLSIHDNSELDELSGLEQLAQVRELEIRNNPELTSLRGLSGVTRLERLVIEHNGLYQGAGLSSLTDVGKLVIQNNPRLNSLQGLRALSHAASVEIRNNPRLCARGMLPALSRVDGPLTLRENRGLSRPDVKRLLGRVEQGIAPATGEAALLQASLP